MTLGSLTGSRQQIPCPLFLTQKRQQSCSTFFFSEKKNSHLISNYLCLILCKNLVHDPKRLWLWESGDFDKQTWPPWMKGKQNGPKKTGTSWWGGVCYRFFHKSLKNLALIWCEKWLKIITERKKSLLKRNLWKLINELLGEFYKIINSLGASKCSKSLSINSENGTKWGKLMV